MISRIFITKSKKTDETELIHTEKRLVVASSGWVWVDEMGESGWNVPASSYKVNPGDIM